MIPWFSLVIAVIKLCAAVMSLVERNQLIDVGVKQEREREMTAVFLSLAQATQIEGEWAKLSPEAKDSVREAQGWYRD